MTRAEKIAAKKLDNEIEQIYRENCNGIQVSIMQIPAIFEVGRKAHAEGRDIKEAIVSYVNSIRRN